MKLYVGVTDNDWFNYLATMQPLPDEVNFWKPGGTNFKALEVGEPFVFKLRSPNNYIAGGGFFSGYARLPLSLVWSSFGKKNGSETQDEFSAKVLGLRRLEQERRDPVIGCVMLTGPFFFPQDEWLPAPSDWARNIVQGKSYDMSEGVGAELWEVISHKLKEMAQNKSQAQQEPLFASEIPEKDRFGKWTKIRTRLGQGTFRVNVTDAYSKRCAITTEEALTTLQAAHIKPYSKGGAHEISNGILLRADLHLLLDRGYMTVDNKNFEVKISSTIEKQYPDSGYRALNKQKITLPDSEIHRPARDLLEWHSDTIFIP